MSPPLSSTKLMPVQNPDLRRTVAAQMERYKERLAQNIKRERLRHGQKPADVAYNIGVDKRTYERWEEGETAPQPPNLKQLAHFFGTTVETLRPDLQAESDQLDRIEAALEELQKGQAALAASVAELVADRALEQQQSQRRRR